MQPPDEVVSGIEPSPRAGSGAGTPRRYMAAAAFLITRLAFGSFFLVSSTYCLLLYIPFSYFGFIHNPILWWLPGFVRLHAWLFAISLSAVTITLLPQLRLPKMRFSVAAFIAVNCGMCFYLAFISPLGNIVPDFNSYLWSMYALFPLMWLGAIDFASARLDGKKISLRAPRGGEVKTAVWAAIVTATVFAITSTLRQLLGSPHHISAKTRLAGVVISMAAHIAIFVLIAGLFYLIRRVAMRLPNANLTYFVVSRFLVWMLCAAVVLKIPLPSISFFGNPALVVSLVIALAFVVSVEGTVAALSVRLAKSEEFADEGSLVTPRQFPSAKFWTASLGLFALLILAYAIPAEIAKTDWDFVVQKLCVLLLWAAVYVFISRQADDKNAASRNAMQRKKDWGLASGVALLIASLTLVGFRELDTTALQDSNWDNIVGAYAGTDISFKAASDILARSLASDDHDAFYQYLQRHTNLPRTMNIHPAKVDLVPHLSATTASKPNIFFFVIDSLRRDYVPPYNPEAASYAPSIASFAQDSVVFQKAFTRYAGTALSEPAIWVGAMQAHKQFIQPFAPMNNLEKLLDVNDYESFVSVDSILQMMCNPSFPTHRLNQDLKLWGELDLVPTLTEIEQGIDARKNTSRPIFVYTQPQNVHTVTLEQEKHGKTRHDISVYELRRVDKAFGEFIQFLKARNLYDNSIIIITSDHGDSYGEFGRYGHSDSLFPEVMKIPLIVHVPPAIRQTMAYDVNQVTFSLDLTPSLFYLLGQKPVINRELFGRPLFTDTLPEQQPYSRHDYLLVSSYAPVYGTLSGDGNSLFIADAVNRRNFFYNLADDPEETKNHINPKRDNEGEREVRRKVDLLDQLYQLHLDK